MPPLVDLTGMSDEEAFEHGWDLYQKNFLNQSGRRGELITHDGCPVIFWDNRYDHAFRTSSDRRRRPYDKDVVARTRILRIHWIAKLLACDEEGIVCKEMSPPDRWQRAYYSLEHGHIIWLEPSGKSNVKPTAWRFSTSFNLPVAEIKRTTQRGIFLKK